MHRLCGLPDPTRDELVRLCLQGQRNKLGVAQKQARPLRFRGAVKDPFAEQPRGINIPAAGEGLGNSLTDLRDQALLSIAYDTGLRASELVAVEVGDIIPAIEQHARLLRIARSKGDQEGEGATAYLSPRTVTYLTKWLKAAEIAEDPVFRRVIVRRYAARSAQVRIDPSTLGWNARWNPDQIAPLSLDRSDFFCLAKNAGARK